MSKVRELFNAYIGKKIDKQEYIRKMHDMHTCLFEYSEFIKDRDISKIEITSNTVVMTSREADIKVICDKNDYRIAPIEILNFSSYEKDESDLMVKLLSKICEKELVVFDIGANIGWYSINFAKLHGDSKVYAFEPVPKTHDYLIANCMLNGVENVVREKKALSNKKGSLDIYYYPEGSGNASLRNLTEVEGVQVFTADVTTMDDYMEEHSLKGLDFIKCDVEGAELFVFKGGEKTIRECKPVIFTEMLRKWSAKFEYHPNEIIDYLGGFGYQCFVSNLTGGLSKFGAVDENTLETNYFFLHKEKHASLLVELTN